MPNWKKLIVSGSDASLSTLTITNSGSTDDSLLLTATEDSSTAAPVATFKRNSSSPGDADYLGQLKFKGENDADQEVVYAKITAKIQDASDGSEDGLIEFANKKAGSNNITARLRSDKLQLINGTELEVDGQVSASSFIGDGSGLTGLVSGTTNYVPIYDSSGITESLISQSTYGEENDTQVVIAAQRTFINSQVVTTTYSSPSGTALRLGGIGNTNEIRIEGADIESATDAAKKILTVGQDGQIHTADGNELLAVYDSYNDPLYFEPTSYSDNHQMLNSIGLMVNFNERSTLTASASSFVQQAEQEYKINQFQLLYRLNF